MKGCANMNDFATSRGLSMYWALLLFAALLTTGCGRVGYGGCQLPGQPPRLAGTPIPSQSIPADASTTTAATVLVKVVVDSTGAVTSASIVQSSNNAAIDAAALS